MGQTLSDVRAEFHAAVLEPEKSTQFHTFIHKIENPTVTEQAYQAVSEALLAQLTWNPFKKLSQVMKYDMQMAEAIEKEPQNVEIRFLRMAIEYNLPPFLGMSTHLEEDVDEIVMNLAGISQMKVNQSFGKYIFYFLAETKLCSEEQLALLRSRFEDISNPNGG